MTNPAINGYGPVYQNQWGITCQESEKTKLRTSHFGPCTIVTCYHAGRQIAFLAHFDVMTDIDVSLGLIFNRLKELKIPIEELETQVFGGWERWNGFIKYEADFGIALVNRIKTYGVTNIDTTQQYKKWGKNYPGLEINALDGKVRILEEKDEALDKASDENLEENNQFGAPVQPGYNGLAKQSESA